MKLVRPFDVLLDSVAGWRFRGDPDPAITHIEATPAGLGLRREDAAGGRRASASATLARLRFAKTAAVWQDRLLILDAPPPGPPPVDSVAARARTGLWSWAPGMATIELVPGIGPEGPAPRQLAAPRALIVSERDELVIADTGNARVQIFTLPDLALRAILTLRERAGEAPPWRPVDVAGEPTGGVIVADAGGRIVRFDRQGRHDPRYRGELPAGSRPELIAVNREGFCYVALERTDRVLILDPYGRLAATADDRLPGDLAAQAAAWLERRGGGAEAGGFGRALDAVLPGFLEARLPAPSLVMDGPRVVLFAPTVEGCRAAPVTSPIEVDAAGAIRLGSLATDAALDLLLGSAAPDPLGSRPLADGALAEALALGDVPTDRPPRPDEIATVIAAPGEYGAIEDEHVGVVALPRLDALAAWLKDVSTLLELIQLCLSLLVMSDHRLVVGRRGLERLRRALVGRLKPGPFVHRPSPRLRFAGHGLIRLGPLDGGREGNPWDRLQLALDVPDRTAVRLHVAVDDLEDPDLRSPDEPGAEAAWESARANASEWLIQNNRGRFLHLALELEGTRDRTPVVERIVVYARRETSLRYLPAVYQDDVAGRHVLDRLLALTDTVLAEVETEIEDFWLHLDPESAPAGTLPWLASWFDFRFHASWDEATRRRILAHVIEIWAWRGTARGLEQLLMLQDGGDGSLPRVVEGIAAESDPRLQAWFGDIAGAREDAVLVVMPPGSLDRPEARQAILDLVSAYLPAQVRFALRAVTPGVRLDSVDRSGSVIGIDSLLGSPRPWVLPAADALADGGPLDRLLPGAGAGSGQGLRVGSADARVGISSEGWRS
jgi:phage tail-like protein